MFVLRVIFDLSLSHCAFNPFVAGARCAARQGVFTIGSVSRVCHVGVTLHVLTSPSSSFL